MHGAKELGLSIREYFSKAENVAEGQLRHDCTCGFFYAAIEVEAWGGEVIYFDDGPPNSGKPFIQKQDDIKSLEPPRVSETDCLLKVLKCLELLKAKVGDEASIIGVVTSPFSLPDEVLMAVSEAVHKWGRYPLDWVKDYGK